MNRKIHRLATASTNDPFVHMNVTYSPYSTPAKQIRKIKIKILKWQNFDKNRKYPKSNGKSDAWNIIAE